MAKSFSKINLERVSWLAAILMTVTAVFLHFFSASMAGGLWHDEVGMANIALLPKKIVWGLMHDHCPVVFPAVYQDVDGQSCSHQSAGKHDADRQQRLADQSTLTLGQRRSLTKTVFAANFPALAAKRTVVSDRQIVR